MTLAKGTIIPINA